MNSRPSSAAQHRARTYRRGLQAEWLAGWFLRLRGWRILARRVRNPYGELDLIAARGRTLAFIEVKARPTQEDGLYAIQPHQQARIIRAASAWLASHPAYAQHNARLDLVVVSGLCHIHHVPHAFDAGGI